MPNFKIGERALIVNPDWKEYEGLICKIIGPLKEYIGLSPEEIFIKIKLL